MRIIVKEKGRPAQTLLLTDEPVILGRSSTAAIQLDSTYSSGKHCVLSFDGDRLTVQDLGSTNGTFLNGQKIDTATVKPGDRLLVGTALVLVSGDDEPPDLEQLTLQYDEGDTETRDQVVGMLGVLGAPEAVTLLGRALSDASSTVRETAAASLGALGSPGAGAQLVAALADDDKAVRRRAKWALIRTADPAATPLLIDATIATEPQVRLAAIHVASMLQLSEAAPAIVQAMGAEEYRVREAAVRALGALGDSVAVPHLIAALTQPDRYPAAWVIESLGDIKHQDALPELVAHLSHAVVEVREAAAHALGLVWSRQTVTHLLGALQDESPAVRRSAAASLNRIRRTLEPQSGKTHSTAHTMDLSTFGDAGASEPGGTMRFEQGTGYWQAWWEDMQRRLSAESDVG